MDWDAVESHSRARHRGLVRQLRLLAALADAHRSAGAARSQSRLADSRLSLPTTWGPLGLIEQIGCGSFGAVYRAWDRRLDRYVALKLLYDTEATHDDVSSTIITEGRLLARVRHPNVVTIHGADRIDGRVGLWMEFVHGQTLDRLLAERGTFGPQEALLVGLDLCRALSAVHHAGVVHRDIKAQNVVREEGGRIVLMDFGTGREPAFGADDMALSGTPLYLAPEIFAGHEATAQSDIYSLGVLLFHLVTRSFPVIGRTLDEVGRHHAEGRRVRLRDLRPDIPELFVGAIERALAPDSARRYQSAGEMEHALLHGVAGLDRRRPSEAAVGRPNRLAARRWITATAVIAVAVVVFTLALLRRFQLSSPSPAPADGPRAAALEVVARRMMIPPHMFVGRPSPDGRWLSYVDPNGDLCLRDVATGATRALTNKGQSAEGAESQSVFSPDGRWLAYTWRALDGVVEIRVVGTDGAWPRVLLRRTDVSFPNPLQWTADGRQILVLLELTSRDQQLALLSVDDGAATPLGTFSGGRLHPSISPDGTLVALDRPQADNSRERDVYGLRVNNPGELLPIVQHPANDLFPMWSADGRLIFVSDRTGTLGLWAVRVTDAGPANQPELLARDLGRIALPLGLTDDGALFTYVQNGMVDVYTQTIDRSGVESPGTAFPAAPTFVGMNQSSEWSPDGRSLAYVSLRGFVQNDRFSRSLVIRDLATGYQRELWPPLMFFIAPHWSPDGRTILVRGSDLEAREGLYAVDVATGNTSAAVVFPVSAIRSAVFGWSPDGRSVWYDNTDARAVIAHHLATQRESVVVEYGSQSILRLVQGPGFRISPDGRSVAYTGFVFHENKAGTVVQVRSPEGLVLELARASSPERVEVQDWMPDGKSVVLIKSNPAQRRAHLYEARLDGTPMRQILAHADMRNVSVRPDGRAITYTAGANGLEVWVLENFLSAAETPR